MSGLCIRKSGDFIPDMVSWALLHEGDSGEKRDPSSRGYCACCECHFQLPPATWPDELSSACPQTNPNCYRPTRRRGRSLRNNKKVVSTEVFAISTLYCVVPIDFYTNSSINTEPAGKCFWNLCTCKEVPLLATAVGCTCRGPLTMGVAWRGSWCRSSWTKLTLATCALQGWGKSRHVCEESALTDCCFLPMCSVLRFFQ